MDILIIRGRSRTSVEGVSYWGKRWLERNLVGEGPVWSINNEVLEDFIKDLQEHDLEIEVK